MPCTIIGFFGGSGVGLSDRNDDQMGGMVGVLEYCEDPAPGEENMAQMRRELAVGGPPRLDQTALAQPVRYFIAPYISQHLAVDFNAGR